MKKFNVFWEEKLVAEVIDYGNGFIDSVYDLDDKWDEVEVEIKEIAGTPIQENSQKKVDTQPVTFVGWTYGDEGDRKYLRSMGVEGEMCWTPGKHPDTIITVAGRTKKGSFSYCQITMEVAKRLKDECPYFFFAGFSGVDKDGRLTQHQPLGKWVHYDKRAEWVE